MIDPISDMLTRIRNAQRALLPTVEIPHSKMKESIANILKKEGYVGEITVAGKPLKTIKLQLKYQGKKSVIEGIKRVSRPVCASMSARLRSRACAAASVWRWFRRRKA